MSELREINYNNYKTTNNEGCINFTLKFNCIFRANIVGSSIDGTAIYKQGHEHLHYQKHELRYNFNIEFYFLLLDLQFCQNH